MRDPMILTARLALLPIVTALTHHTARQASIVVGSTLYIDGGEIITWDGSGNGTEQGSTLTTNNITTTISLDLSQSWTNSTIAITTTPKTTTSSFQSGALWGDYIADAFYSYDGGLSLAQGLNVNPPPNQLLRFSPNTQWTQSTVTGNFSKLVRVQEALYATGNGVGFALGGYQHAGTTQHDPPLRNNIYVQGLVMYNSSSQLWYNYTVGGSYAGKDVQDGAGVFIAERGPIGLFMPLGGLTGNGSHFGFDTLTIFEPQSQQWQTQRTSGDIPPALRNPCAVGVVGDNGTYEVFMIGGLQAPENDVASADGAVYVLTLPAFHWFKVPSTTLGRYRHSCAYDNSRQIISAGGIVVNGTIPAAPGTEDNGIPDPWPNGLGVFDMTALQWVSRYDNAAALYTTPDIVKAYVASNGNQPSSYDASAVRSWFAISRTANGTSPSSSSDPVSSDSASVTSVPSTGSSALSSGAIAGIAIAAVIAVALLALGAWFVVRRNKRRQAYDSVNQQASEGFPQDVKGHYGEPAVVEHEEKKALDVGHTAATPAPAELHDRSRPHETEGTQVYELDHARHELE